MFYVNQAHLRISAPSPIFIFVDLGDSIASKL